MDLDRLKGLSVRESYMNEYPNDILGADIKWITMSYTIRG